MKQIKRCLVVLVFLAAVLPVPLAHAEGGLVFQPYWTFHTEVPVVAVATGDIDGDGTPEVVAATAGGVVYVLGNDGDLAWRYEAGFELADLVVGELYGDGGAAEILAQGENRLMLTETQRPAWSSSGESLVSRRSVAVDLNGDGRPELVGAKDNSYLSVFDPKSGSSGNKHSLGRPSVAVWAGEIDGDGRPELVPTLAGGRDIMVLEDDLVAAWTRQIPDELGLVQGGDLDGDGQAEVVVLSAAWKLYVLESDGSLAWQTESLSVGKYTDAPVPDQLLVQDLDGDGRAEIVAAAPGPAATIHVFDGRGEQVWRHALEGVSTPTRLAAGDIDGDGQAELMVTAEGQEPAYLLNAAGERLAEYATGKTTGALACADLNGDGRGEIIVGSETGLQVFGASHQLAWRELWRSPRLLGAVTAVNLIDGIGDSWDEVAVGSDSGRVYLLGEAGKVLWEADLEEFVRTLGAGDVDGDGRREVVAATWDVKATGKGQLHLLDGDQRRWTIPVGGYIISVAVRDLDGDGRAEIIAGSATHSRGLVQILDGAGAVAWQRELDQPVTAVTGDGGQVLAGTRSGRIYRLVGSAHALRPFGSPGTTNGTVMGEYDLGVEVLAIGEGLAATADGRVYRLGENGPSLVRELGWAVKWVQVGADWIAVLGDGQVSLLAGDGSLRQGTLYGKGTSLAVSDLNGDGELEVAVGTNQGRVHLYGLALDQPPLLTGPDLTETRTGYAYSVNVSDPEQDAVPIALQIWDPSPGGWLAYPAQSLAVGQSQGQLTWEVADPFDIWDSGQESRFRFVYDVGGTQRTTQEIGGPFTIPTTPPALYYGQRAGLAALLLLVPGLGLLLYRRQRAYRRSPVGQAEALLKELRSSPQESVPRLRELARRDPAQLALLSGLALRQAHGRAAEPAIAEVSQGLYLILTRPELAADGLRAVLAATDSQHAGDITILYALFQAMLEANTLARVVVLRPQLSRPDRFSTNLSGLDAEIAETLSELGRTAEALRNFQRVELAEDKIAYLAQAIETLGRLQRGIPERLPQPERNILARVAFNWLAVASNALQDLQGRAQIEVSLKTRQVLHASDTALALELTNKGRSPASNLTVALDPDGDHQYQVSNGAAHVDILPAGRSTIVELPFTAATSTDHFRAEFAITFDDAERGGKTLAFADMVHLLRPAAAFEPMPNPYAPGTPLAPGSPLFFGRDDLFQFVQENLPGLARQNILVLVGQRRMGKTSFLRQLTTRLGEGYLPVYLDGQALGVDPGMPNFFYDLALAIGDALAGQGLAAPAVRLEDLRERPSQTFERAFLPSVLEAAGERRLLLLFDEFEELEMRVASSRLDIAIFPFLRHLMQHSPRLGFLFVGTHRLEALSRDYWSIFFNAALYKHVTFLGETAARALIVQPVAGYGLGYDDLAVDKLLRVTAGHPYFLQLSCHALVNHANRQRRGYLTIQDVNGVLEEIVELGEAHFAFLWEQASLQERLMLAALTRLAGREVNVTAGQVAELLTERGILLALPEVNEALRRLVEQDVIREVAGQPPRYEYKVELLRLWVERYQALERIMEEV